MQFSSISEILNDIKNGHFVMMMDHAERENEGDLILAAQHANKEKINFLLQEARGLICLALTQQKAQQLELPLMPTRFVTAHQAAFTVSIDAITKMGTGVSARERAQTMRLAADPESQAAQFLSPGHVFPLIAHAKGVLGRAGHTEAALDLARLADCWPAGITCEVLDQNGESAQQADLFQLAQKFKIKLGRIEDLIRYRQETGR